jgi:hypothetical protein
VRTSGLERRRASRAKLDEQGEPLGRERVRASHSVLFFCFYFFAFCFGVRLARGRKKRTKK